jgi:hypothetical protein
MFISDIMLRLQVIKDVHGDLQVVGDRGDPDIAVLEAEGEFDICVHIG